MDFMVFLGGEGLAGQSLKYFGTPSIIFLKILRCAYL
jgi:hypothetical protein